MTAQPKALSVLSQSMLPIEKNPDLLLCALIHASLVARAYDGGRLMLSHTQASICAEKRVRQSAGTIQQQV